ncbi:UvrABC system protein B [bioreactor metagenome]|uniref:UvrABC system protein B n=1 Tax=bioreactor metagenome TaxID=1076179 RepID=A0A645IYP1_9ZZZZ
MYGDTITNSMRNTINETNRRRVIQEKYNQEHNIIPRTIQKSVRDILEISFKKDLPDQNKLSKKEKEELIVNMTKEMRNAAKLLEFEYAAILRDKIKQLSKE